MFKINPIQYKLVFVQAIITIAFIFSSVANAASVKIGILSSETGAMATFSPDILSASRLAINQVNTQGGVFRRGLKLEGIFVDSGCNSQDSINAADKAIYLKNVVGIIGPNCSNAVLSTAELVTIPADTILISPSATSPLISRLHDKDLVYRTAPSDALQSQYLAHTLIKKGLNHVAIIYVANNYGRELASAFKKSFTKKGGKISFYKGHSDSSGSFRSMLMDSSTKGAPTLVLFDYASGSGFSILRQALEEHLFDNFVGGDVMKSQEIIDKLRAYDLRSFYASAPVQKENGKATQLFDEQYTKYGGNKNTVFAANAYDATFLLALAIEKAGHRDNNIIKKQLRSVASEPGVIILPGEWAKAKKAIAEGQEINYQGASSNVDFDDKGDVSGNYSLFKVHNGKWIVDVK